MQFLYQLDLRQSEFDEKDLKLFWGQLQDSAKSFKERDFNKACDFANELIPGIIPLIPELDEELKRHSSNWPIERMAVVDRNMLRIGAYELLKMDTATEIVINEAVEVSKAFSEKDSPKFINAILDQIHKNKSE